MDLIIRLNPSTENQLIKKQKEILFNLNSQKGKSIFFPHYPVYCTLKNSIFTERSPNEIKKMISGLSIDKIEIKDFQLFFTVEIQTETTSASEKILIGTTEEKVQSETLGELNLNCRSFQIAELKKTGFTYEIWNPVWCKLK